MSDRPLNRKQLLQSDAVTQKCIALQELAGAPANRKKLRLIAFPSLEAQVFGVPLRGAGFVSLFTRQRRSRFVHCALH